MILQLLIVVGAFVGAVAGYDDAILLAGGLSLMLDVRGFANGTLKPLAPLFFYLVGYLATGSWIGVLYGALFGQVVELFLGLPLAFFVARRLNQ